jgi:hypothetical protein
VRRAPVPLPARLQGRLRVLSKKLLPPSEFAQNPGPGEYSEPSYEAEAKDCNLVRFGFADDRELLA